MQARIRYAAAFLLCGMLALLLCLLLAPAANAVEWASVSYLDQYGALQTCPDAEVVDNSDGGDLTLGTAGGTTWYVLNGNVSATYLAIEGTVNLILQDGCTLTTSNCVVASDPGDHLIVWGQSGGTGKLDANGGRWEAGIQLNGNGALTVNGGVVDAAGGEGGAGIGSSSSPSGGVGISVLIEGGTVEATGSSDIVDGSGAGIGGGKRSNGGTITITGGKVTASGVATSAGIGGGQFGSAGTIVISGGSITAEGGSNGADRGGAGIGNGASFSEQQNGSVTISGGVIAATGNGGAADIGNGSPNYAGTDTAFSTGQNGDAVIFAEEISDEGGEDGWTGVFFRGSDGEVRGNVSPAEDFQIPAGGTLHFEDGSTLNLPGGTYLPGSIALTGDGTLNPEEKRPQAQVSIGGDPGKTWDGAPATLARDGYSCSGNGTPAVSWHADGGDAPGAELAAAPSDAGSYWVKVAVSTTGLYRGAEAAARFDIAKAPLDAPEGIVLSSTAPETMSVAWDAVDHAVGYTVQLLANGEPAGSPAETAGTNCSFPISEAGAYRVVVAVLPDGNHLGSEAQSAGFSFYEVAFDAGGGSAVEPQLIAEGGLIEQPADPARDGWTFAGWYADAELALPWDFAEDAVDGPTTLHAKWTEKAQPEEPGGGGDDDPEGDSGKDPADDEGRDPDKGLSDGNDGSGASGDGDGTRKGSLARTGDSGILLASGAVAFAVASGAAAWAAARARRR